MRKYLPVSNTPSNNTPRISLCSDMDGEDLGRVEPGNSKPGSTKDEGIQINHGRSGSAPLIRSVDIAICPRVEAATRQPADEEHGDSLTNRAPVEGPSAPDTIDGVHADQGGKHVEDVIKAGNPLCLAGTKASNMEDR